MANTLVKNQEVEVVTELVMIPGTPYQPARPGYYSVETQVLCGWRYEGPGRWEIWTDPGNPYNQRLVWIPTGGGSYGTATYVCEEMQVNVYHPPTPAVPATPPSFYPRTEQRTGYNLGWNSGARSIGIFTDDANVQFQASPSNVGVIVGMNVDDGAPVTYNGNTINYGFYLARGIYRIMQNGALTGGVAGTYDNDTIFRIERVDDTITYKVNGVTRYTVASGAATGPGWLEAAMYSAQDIVFNPSIEQISAPDTTEVTGDIAGDLPGMRGVMVAGVHADIAGDLPAMTGGMEAGLLAPSFAVMGGSISIFSGDMLGLTGEIGSMGGELPKVFGLMADHAYGAMAGNLPPVQGVMYATEGNNRAFMGSTGFSVSAMASRQILLVVMTSTGQIAATMTAKISLSAQMLSVTEMVSTMTFSSIEQALMFSYLLTRSLALVPDDEEVETWVVELDNGAFGSSQYSNYSFNSYATIGGRLYGANRHGLYLLEGDTDDGAPIRASIDFGKLDFGAVTKKTISECFIGVSGKGALFLKVVAEGESFIYRADWADEEMQQQRFKLGKGLKASYIRPILYNANGDDFELDSVQFVLADLSRKL